jgi:recombination protein RecA
MLAATAPHEPLPQEFLQRAKRIGVSLGTAVAASESFLPFGFGQLSPEQGLLRGQVTELCVARSGGLVTSLALSACVAAQRQGLELGSSAGHWCAYVDPAASLYAPGVHSLGVALERLLVVRPPLEALASVTLRLVRSKTCVLVVVDTAGVPGKPLNVDLGAWVRVVRQMSIALEGTQCSVLLITDAEARRPLALPVARRIELSRPSVEQLELRIVKDRFREPEQARRVAHRCPTFAETLRRSA